MDGYDPRDINRSQNRGFADHPRLSADPIMAAACKKAWPPKALELAYGAAKLLPSRKARLLAILRHVSCVSAIQESIREKLNDLDRRLWRYLASLMDSRHFLELAQLAKEWVATGDSAIPSLLGMGLSKHPGYPGLIGDTKRKRSSEFAALARAFLDRKSVV